MVNLPKLKLIMPRIPAILDIRWTPEAFPSLNRRVPEGLSTIKAGAFGVEGELKAYCEAEACTLMSRNGINAAIVMLSTCACRQGWSSGGYAGNCCCVKVRAMLCQYYAS